MKSNSARIVTLLMSVGFALGLTSAAQAQVTIGTGYTPGNSGGANTFGSTADYWVDVFTVPSGSSDLTSISAWYNSNGSTGNSAVMSLYAWNGTTETGPALFSGTEATPSSLSPVTFSGLNVVLTPGDSYAVNFASEAFEELYYNSSDSAVAGYFFAGSTYSLEGTNSIDVSLTFGASAVPEHSWLIWGGLGMIAGLAFWTGRRHMVDADVAQLVA